jgi:hypothetical protein
MACFAFTKGAPICPPQIRQTSGPLPPSSSVRSLSGYTAAPEPGRLSTVVVVPASASNLAICSLNRPTVLLSS